MPLVPNRFLFRMAIPCLHVAKLPRSGEDLLDLPQSCRLDNHAGLDDLTNFADVRIAWNEGGLAIQAQVAGKERAVQGDAARPRQADGLTVWIDTRDARASHRASRYCHQFHFLPTGGGSDKDEPAFVQSKINRALGEPPMAAPLSVPFRVQITGSGYRIEAFLSSVALHGWDPEQHPRLGFFYAVHDQELGTQTSAAGPDLPYVEDPSLWSVLELRAPA